MFFCYIFPYGQDNMIYGLICLKFPGELNVEDVQELMMAIIEYVLIIFSGME